MKLRSVSSVLLVLAGCAVAPDAEEISSSASTAVCGNGVREAGEQCDDGNTTSHDGCSATCSFEQTHRVTSLAMSYATSTFCPANAIGKAIGSQAQGQLQTALGDAIRNGSMSVLLAFGGLSDLGGQNAPAITIDSMLGKPADGAGYDGTRDLDWWYGPTSGARTMTGAIANGALTAKGEATFGLALGAGAEVAMSGTRVRAKIGSANAPLASTGGTPGHLAATQLDPALASFATTSDGELCGNISAASLAAMAVPAELTEHCSAYTTANSILDVFVGGCKVFFVTVIAKTQPDQADAAAPAAGAGAPYVFKVGAGNRVTGCNDRGGAPADLATCLRAAAYSSAFTFGTGRVIRR